MTNVNSELKQGEGKSVMDVVKDIVANELRVDRSQLNPSTQLVSDLGADSLDALNIAVQIEEAFSINIPDDMVPSFRTIGDIVKGVEEHLSTK